MYRERVINNDSNISLSLYIYIYIYIILVVIIVVSNTSSCKLYSLNPKSTTTRILTLVLLWR